MTTGTPESGSLTWAQLNEFFPHRRIVNYIRPLPDSGVVYVKNPKAGCSTVMVYLDRVHTGEVDSQYGNIHKDHRLPKIGDVGRPKVVRMLEGGAYRFSFVRDPLRRLESAYWDKFVHSGNRRWRDQLVPRPADQAPAELSFEQFLDAIEQQDPVGEMDPHWRPQHVNLMHPLVTYDRLGRIESFDADLRLIREEAGLPDVPYDVRNPSKNTSGGSVFDGRPDLVARVQALFAQDFELYGY